MMESFFSLRVVRVSRLKKIASSGRSGLHLDPKREDVRENARKNVK